MGNANISNSEYQSQNSYDLRITLDYTRPVLDEMKQLLNWSLEEIRDIYAPFRKRKSSPILTRSEFLRFIRLSRISAFHMYDKMCEKEGINIFEVLSILVLTAHTTYTYKIQFLCNSFDLRAQKSLKFQDLILMFKSIVRGYVILTAQQIPSITLLQKYAQTIFSRADLNNDQNLQLSEILNWVEENRQAMDLFHIFEPELFGKEQYHIFNLFCPYQSRQIQTIFERIAKVHAHESITLEDYMLLTAPSIKKVESQLTLNRGQGMSNSVVGKQNKDSTLKTTDMTINHIELESIGNSPRTTVNQLKFPQIRPPFNPVSYNKSPISSPKPKFRNIIIINGRTITKKEIFELKQYFEKLSCGKECILIEDFIESFNQEKYNHMKSVAASLYNFLDHNQNGQVTFKKLLMKLYPNLTPANVAAIDGWSAKYSSSINVKNRSKVKKQDDLKKRVLPKTCLPRFKQMFQFFDVAKKGFVVYEDLKRVLGEVCSDKEMQELFEDSDKDCDGKLTLQQFANVLLPSDLQIEGLQ